MLIKRTRQLKSDLDRYENTEIIETPEYVKF